MFSSSGISCRQGPHQLAQKLSITTWPLYCVRLTFEPARESNVNCGAGPFEGPAPEAGTAMIRAAVRSAAIRFFMTHLSLKEYGRTDGRFHIVGELGHAQ